MLLLMRMRRTHMGDRRQWQSISRCPHLPKLNPHETHGVQRADLGRARKAQNGGAFVRLVNQLDHQKNTPLMDAAFLGRCLIVKELIAHAAEVTGISPAFVKQKVVRMERMSS